MKWSHIFLFFILAVAASTESAWWEEIEPFMVKTGGR